MSQLSKTAGALFAVMISEESENVMISKISAFISIIKGQADEFKRRYVEDTDKYPKLCEDYDQLTGCAQKIMNVSRTRDRDISMKNYPNHMTTMLQVLDEVVEIAIRWGFLDFEANTRFSGFMEEK